jgi:hypothetical protein
VNPVVHSARKLVTRAALISAPDSVQVPVDLGIRDDGRYELWLGNVTRPSVGDRYVFSVRYADNTYEVLTATVTGVNDSFATPLAPVGSVPGQTTPTFSWQAPGAMPAGAAYSLYVSENMGPTAWEMWALPPSVTSISYNYGGGADIPVLSSGVAYNWNISVRDASGNRATYSTQFTP